MMNVTIKQSVLFHCYCLQKEIGRGNPVWPQVYRASATTITGSCYNNLFAGDTVYSRCYYTSKGVPFDVSTSEFNMLAF